MYALLDSGASNSLINETIYHQFTSNHNLNPEVAVELYDVQLRKLPTLGTTRVNFSFYTSVYNQELIVTNAISEQMILGIDAILKHGIIIDGKGKQISFPNNGNPTVNKLEILRTVKKPEESTEFNVMQLDTLMDNPTEIIEPPTPYNLGWENIGKPKGILRDSSLVGVKTITSEELLLFPIIIDSPSGSYPLVKQSARINLIN